MNNIDKYLVIAFKGICMGAADVIPGVSGGTIAFLMGIYRELVESIKSVNLTNLKLLFSGKVGEFWRAVNGAFLVSLIGGILISIFSLARLMKYLLEFHPVPLWSFFFGLILASAIYILRELDKWNVSNIVSLIVGIAVAAYICLITPGQTPEAFWFVFLSGAIAVCAMILPGISGSFILLLLGKYAFIMGAVTSLNVPVLAVFAAGAVVGILSFSRLLSWLLKKYYMQTIALLSGFMIGSLIKVWPWKEAVPLDGGLPGEGAVPLIDRPVLPFHFEEITGLSAQTGQALIFVLTGIAVVLVIEMVARRQKKNALDLI